MARFAPRLHVLLAAHAPVGLIIRRGPSKSVATIRWDRRRDEFQLGQWLRGRIYERRSDLSPDGKHFLYFAMNGKWKSEARGSWTAVSRAPYLKALAIFPKGDCWGGGGLWTGNSTYWLDGTHSALRDTQVVQRDTSSQPYVSHGECRGLYYDRLRRDGWTFAEHIQVNKRDEKYIFEKPADKGWTLRKIAHSQFGAAAGKGCEWDEHEFIHRESEAALPFPNWEWADLDGKRVVWAAEGKLYGAGVTKTGLAEGTELLDCNPMTFAPIEAPY
jgi:hypothetical protein